MENNNRRRRGTGGIYPYQTSIGQLWRFKATIGGKRVHRRGFTSADAAEEALAAARRVAAGLPAKPGESERPSWNCLVRQCWKRPVTDPGGAVRRAPGPAAAHPEPEARHA